MHGRPPVLALARGQDRLARPVLAAGLVWLAFLGYPAANLIRHPSLSQYLAAAAVAVSAAAYVRALHRAAYGEPGPPWGTVILLIVIGVVLPLAVGPEWLGIPLYAAVLIGFALPPARASAAAAVIGLLSFVVGAAAGTAAPQELSVPLLTVLAGVMAAGVKGLERIGRELLEARRDAEQLAVARERMRMARDLHDAVKQHLFVASMEAGTAQALIGSRPADAGRHLDNAAEAIEYAQRELAGLIEGSLIPPVDGRGLAASLRDWAGEWSRRHDIALAVRVTGRCPVRADLEEPLLRAAQEALTNVARHSRAGNVQVTLEQRPGGAVLTVSDDGVGFTPGVAEGQGLRGIRERLEIVGGTMTVTSAPGAGTTVRLDCPPRRRVRL